MIRLTQQENIVGIFWHKYQPVTFSIGAVNLQRYAVLKVDKLIGDKWFELKTVSGRHNQFPCPTWIDKPCRGIRITYDHYDRFEGKQLSHMDYVDVVFDSTLGESVDVPQYL